MNRAVAFMFFFGFFFVILLLLNFYVLHRFTTFFGVKRGPGFYLAVLSLALLFVGANLIEHAFTGPLVKGLYFTASVWIGWAFIAACALALIDLTSRFIKLAPHAWGVIAAVVTVALLIVALLSATMLRVREVSLTDARIAAPVRIVQVSDVHIGPILGDRHLARVVEKTRSLAPDIVVITGDLIDGADHFDPAWFKRFDTLGVPVLFITGNHEQYAGLPLVTQLVENTSIRLLRDEETTIKGIRFIGLDNRDEAAQVRPALERVLERTGSSQPGAGNYTVLLYHRPGAFASLHGFDLMLSGHTHGGQIVPFNLLVLPVEKHVAGLHARKDGPEQLFVSQGAGTWGPPMRLGSTDEITLVMLSPG